MSGLPTAADAAFAAKPEGYTERFDTSLLTATAPALTYSSLVRHEGQPIGTLVLVFDLDSEVAVIFDKPAPSAKHFGLVVSQLGPILNLAVSELPSFAFSQGGRQLMACVARCDTGMVPLLSPAGVAVLLGQEWS